MPRGGGDSFGSGQKATRNAISRVSGSKGDYRGVRARYRGALKGLTIGGRKKKKKK